MNSQPIYKPGKADKMFSIGFFAYIFVRFLIAIPALGKYGVSPYVFGVLDVVTAIPYAYGVPRIIFYLRHKEIQRVINWGIILAVSFLIPYIYIAVAGGSNMPPTAIVIFILIVVLLAFQAVLTIRSKLKQETKSYIEVPEHEEKKSEELSA